MSVSARAWLLRVAMLACAVLVPLVVIEGFLRIFAPQPLAFSYRTPLGLTLHIPDARQRLTRLEFDHEVTFNSMGLRDREYAREKPEGTFRILILGDSYAEGGQVPLEETFAKRLESRLAESFPSRRWEVINSGVAGYGTGEEIFFWRLYGRELSPDLVLLAFTVGNDLDDNWTTPFFRWRDPDLEEVAPRPLSAGELFSIRVKEFFASRFHTVQFLRDRMHEIRGFTKTERKSFLKKHRGGLLDTEPTDKLESQWRLTRALLDRLRAEVSEDHAGFLLAAIPMRAQAEDEDWAVLREATEGGLDREAPQRRLAAYAAETGAIYVDLLPALRAASRENRVYFRIDGHFTARGHEVAAAELFAALVKHPLLPAD